MGGLCGDRCGRVHARCGAPCLVEVLDGDGPGGPRRLLAFGWVQFLIWNFFRDADPPRLASRARPCAGKETRCACRARSNGRRKPFRRTYAEVGDAGSYSTVSARGVPAPRGGPVPGLPGASIGRGPFCEGRRPSWRSRTTTRRTRRHREPRRPGAARERARTIQVR